MSESKGLNDMDLLKLCQKGGPITDQDIGGRNVSADQKSSDVTYLSEGTVLGTNFYQFSYDGGKNNDKQ